MCLSKDLPLIILIRLVETELRRHRIYLGFSFICEPLQAKIKILNLKLENQNEDWCLLTQYAIKHKFYKNFLFVSLSFNLFVYIALITTENESYWIPLHPCKCYALTPRQDMGKNMGTSMGRQELHGG